MQRHQASRNFPFIVDVELMAAAGTPILAEYLGDLGRVVDVGAKYPRDPLRVGFLRVV